jgi:hypothetical protein
MNQAFFLFMLVRVKQYRILKFLPGFIKDVVRGAGVATHVGQDPVTVPVGVQQGRHNTHHAGQALITIHQSTYGPRPLALHPAGPSQC